MLFRSQLQLVFHRTAVAQVCNPYLAAHLADALDAPFALLQPRRIPGQVEIDERAQALQVEALRVGMVIDQRMVTLAASQSSRRYGWWLRLSTLEKGKPVWVPLVQTERMEARPGKRALTIQVNQDRETGGLRFGIVTDCSAQFAASREAYMPRCGSLALDVGLKTLLAANDGSRFGQRWGERLAWYDDASLHWTSASSARASGSIGVRATGPTCGSCAVGSKVRSAAS